MDNQRMRDNSTFDQHDKDMLRKRKHIGGSITTHRIIILSIIYILCVVVLIGVTVSIVSKALEEGGGLKPVIEKLWCGNPGCFKN